MLDRFSLQDITDERYEAEERLDVYFVNDGDLMISIVDNTTENIIGCLIIPCKKLLNGIKLLRRPTPYKPAKN